MLKYRALLKSTNFFLNSGGKVRRHGFFTTRFVESDTPEEAEEIAVQLIRDDRVLKAAVLNDVASPPTIYLKEIDEPLHSMASWRQRKATPSIQRTTARNNKYPRAVVT